MKCCSDGSGFPESPQTFQKLPHASFSRPSEKKEQKQNTLLLHRRLLAALFTPPTQSPCLCVTDGNTCFSPPALSLSLCSPFICSPLFLCPSPFFLFSSPSLPHTTFPELTLGPASKIRADRTPSPRRTHLPKLSIHAVRPMHPVASGFTVLIYEMCFSHHCRP